jgi:hypothetical protein
MRSAKVSACRNATFSPVDAQRLQSERERERGRESFHIHSLYRSFPNCAGELLGDVMVEPACGDVVLFYHTGALSPWHAGMPVTGLSGSAEITAFRQGKYVLRTDVLCELDPASMPKLQCPLEHLPVSAPYSECGFRYTSLFNGEERTYCGVAGGDDWIMIPQTPPSQSDCFTRPDSYHLDYDLWFELDLWARRQKGNHTVP